MLMWDFWLNLIQKLNFNADPHSVVPDALNYICEYFHLGCAFVYQADHKGLFELNDYRSVYSSRHIPESFDLEQFPNLIASLPDPKLIFISDHSVKSEPDSVFAEIFNAKYLLLVPVTDQDSNTIAFVGVADRRGAPRYQDQGVDFVYASVITIANYVKLIRYQSRVNMISESLQRVIDNMGIDVYVSDFETHEILFANKSMAAPFGGSDMLVGKRCFETLYSDKADECDHCPKPKLVDEFGLPSKGYSHDMQSTDGSWARVISTAFRWVDGRMAHLVGSFDITEHKKNEEIIRTIAEYDILTGLPNRLKLTSDSDALIPDSPVPGKDAFLIFMDLDGFKLINDTYGHLVGDELLKAIGDELQHNSLTRNKTYRFGGDEFVVFCGFGDFNSIFHVVRFLLERFERHWTLSVGDVSCRASIGIANFPLDATSPSELLRKADIAMYHAKNASSGLAIFYDQGKFSRLDEYQRDYQISQIL